MKGLPKHTVLILSIDGGGIRGYIPALVLAEVERRLAELGREQPLGTSFDFIAGTSTGSIITLGLTAPEELSDGSFSGSDTAFTAAKLAEMYEKHGLEIFPRRIFHQLQEMRHAFTEKYNDGPFHELLDRYFGARTIADALTNVLVTSYDIEKHEPVIMKKVPPRRKKSPPPNYYMADAIKASAAAPTYFEPVKIRTVDGMRHHSLTDGGVFASNPAMCAYVEAQRFFPKARNFVLFSLGTGSFKPDWEYEKVKNWGVLEWIQPSKGVPAAMVLSLGQEQAVDYHLTHLPRVEYHRLNIPLDGCSEDMDDAAPENMECLAERARELIRREEKAIARMVELLK
jgi:patatin-like phospholipase/acyl hydrolase